MHIGKRMRNLIRQFFDRRDILIILEVVQNFKEPLEEQCSFSILPVGMLFHLLINLRICLLFASWAKVAVPLTNMWRWFKVVMAVVRFLLAVSSCFMSLVISFTFFGHNVNTFCGHK